MAKRFDRVKAGLRYIVVHHTASEQPLLKAWNPFGYEAPEYDFGIDLDGVFHVGRSLKFQGAHCLPDQDKDGGKYFLEPTWWNETDGRTDSGYMNQRSIGFVIAGSFDKRKATDSQINEACYNIRRLAKKYRIPLDRDHIIPHFRVSATFCPGQDAIERIYKKLKI